MLDVLLVFFGAAIVLVLAAPIASIFSWFVIKHYTQSTFWKFFFATTVVGLLGVALEVVVGSMFYSNLLRLSTNEIGQTLYHVVIYLVPLATVLLWAWFKFYYKVSTLRSFGASLGYPIARYALVLIFTYVPVGLALFNEPAHAPSEDIVTEEVFTIPESQGELSMVDRDTKSFFFDPDQHRFAYSTSDGINGGFYVDGKEEYKGKLIAPCMTPSVVFGQDLVAFAYYTVRDYEKKEYGCYVQVNDKTFGPYAHIGVSYGRGYPQPSVLVSKKNDHYAFTARKGQSDFFLVHDGVEVPFVTSDRLGSMPGDRELYDISADGVLAVQTSKIEKDSFSYDAETQTLEIRGRQTDIFNDHSSFQFNEDGKHFMFVDKAEIDNNDNFRTYIDGTKLIPNTVASDFSSGDMFAYTSLEYDPTAGQDEDYPGYPVEEKILSLVDLPQGSEWPWNSSLEFKKIGDPCTKIKMSPNGNRYLCESFKYRFDEPREILIDGKKEGPYNNIMDMIFSENSEGYAYSVGVGGKGFASGASKENAVIHNGVEIARVPAKSDGTYLSSISSLTLSSDGAHVAFKVAKEGGEYVVVDGKKGETYDLIGALVFEGDSLSYLALKGKRVYKVSHKIAI